MCDGIFHCMHGEDEVFDICEHVYPDIATIKCIENRVKDINVTIMAIPCDGIQECRDGSDEKHCSGETNNYLVTIVTNVTVF